MTNAIAVYAAAVGVLMAAWWALALLRGAWGRKDRTYAELGLHLGAELLTAAALLASGIAVLAGGPTAFLAAALGMLLYTTIASPGYFLARGEVPMVAMFGVLAALTASGLVVLLV
ncbi:MAG TPA: hypothetical protein VF097_07420 [Actinomycetota bacterium]